MTIRWVTAFLDLPAAVVEDGAGFWGAVTATTPSARRGDREEFRTLVPADGDAHLRVQAVADGPGGVHLDLHVDDVEAAADRAVALGAEVVARPGHIILRSPGGLPFCAVAHHGEATPPRPISHGGATTRVDQVSIDVPAPRFERECAFWAGLTSWELQASRLSEFAALDRPAGIPWRILLQRLGPDDTGASARAHLDVACGTTVEAAISHHRSLGARRGSDGVVWTTMTDPAGMPYCLTQRDPITGRIEP
ncbi:MAG: VOC family protein [Actinomycetota bacterium]